MHKNILWRVAERLSYMYDVRCVSLIKFLRMDDKTEYSVFHYCDYKLRPTHLRVE
jgi:hypothetical protein